MVRTIGTKVMGIRTPIIKQGDDLVEIVVNSLKKSWETEGYAIRDKDVVGITESLVARAQGNFVTVDDIAFDISKKFKDDIGIVFPITSRNRFAIILQGIAKACRKVYVILSYPSDEVGNHLMDINLMDEAGINPYADVLSEQDYRKIFGQEVKHGFTGIDYIQMYKDLAVNDNIEIYLSNNPKTVLNFTKNVLVADIHSRDRTKKILQKAGAEIIYGLDEICSESINGSGFNPEYGLLGSNKASEDKLKLFPRNGEYYVYKIQKRLFEITGKHVEVMIFGDGAFKDPVGKIWELADPVVSPAFTPGLAGTPNEIKLKYVADMRLNDIDSIGNDDDLEVAMKEYIKQRSGAELEVNDTLGTTPRQVVDLLGSLCDLTSGSGDKGTPVVLVQGYFDNYSCE